MTIMKLTSFVTGIAVCSSLVLATACKKEEPPSGPQTPKAGEAATPDAAKVADTAKATAQQAADKAQGVIDKAQALVKDNKFQDALSTLSQLADLKLTPEQQKLVDDLKAQIQSAMAKGAASDAVGGVLGGKK
jgi:hypothetical protein